ncbi:MAG: ShlB/FhaC/HecB family hemolysin secretion/activation protein [Pseudomonadota bacterium]
MVIAALSGAAYAQTAAQQVEAAQRAPTPRLEPLRGPSIRFTSQRPPENAESIRFTLEEVIVDGAGAIDGQELQAAYADRLGQEVALTAVFEIAAALQEIYRDAGYVFTRAIVPAQEIGDGIVRIEVIEARIENVVVEEPNGPVGPVIELVRRLVAPLEGKLNPTGEELERTLLILNNIPGVIRATAVPQPAPDTRGGLILYMNVEHDPVEGAIFADNRQIPGVGRALIGGAVTFNSYSGSGDTTTIAYFNSFGYLSDGFGADDGPGDLDERNTLQVTHSRYIGDDGLVGSVRGLYSRTKPGDDLASIDIDGEQILFGAELSFPLLTTRRETLNVRGGLELMNATTDVSSGATRVTDDKLRSLYLTFDGLLRDDIGQTRFELSLRQGLDVLGASDPDTDAQLSRLDGRGDYTLLRASVERLFIVNEELSFQLRAGGQLAATPVLASEEFAIGGLTFGRGFDPSEFTGDDGFGLSAEWRYTQPISVGEFAVTAEGYVFGDYGYISNKNEGEPGSQDLLSAGVGARFYFPDDLLLGVEMAFPLDQPLARTADTGKDARFFLNLQKVF